MVNRKAFGKSPLWPIAQRSLLKRALKGTYVSVEPFHLFRYLDEQAFRFNNRRDMNDADRFSLAISSIVGKRLMYKDLIGAGNTPTAN